MKELLPKMKMIWVIFGMLNIGSNPSKKDDEDSCTVGGCMLGIYNALIQKK